jgi:hypothetical protein
MRRISLPKAQRAVTAHDRRDDMEIMLAYDHSRNARIALDAIRDSLAREDV